MAIRFGLAHIFLLFANTLLSLTPTRGMQPAFPPTLRQELELLQRVLYKCKSQHRQTRYYQHARHVVRLLGRLDALDNGADREQLIRVTCASAQKAYASVRDVLRRSFFMPMSMVMLAIFARI